MRKTRDTLTGGTGDVSPQQLVIPQLPTSAANTFTQYQQTVPVTRVPNKAGKSVVMELLKVFFDHPTLDINAAAGGNSQEARIQLSTTSLSAIDLDNPRVLAHSTRTWRGAFSAGGTYSTIN